MSLTVGSVRVALALVALGLVTFVFVTIPFRWVFWAYLAASLIVLSMIYLEVLSRDVRAFAIGVVDVAFLTYFVHLVGSFSFAVVGYPVQGTLYALAIGPRVAMSLTALGACSYVAVLTVESVGILPYGPYAPEWLRGEGAPLWTSLAIATSVVLVSFVATSAVIRLSKRLALERSLSDALLLNVLPASIAERLKTSPEAIAERFEDASVLFADIVGFTPLSTSMPPEHVVALLAEVFARFDALAEHHGLEKIKTIGDAYLAAGGIPVPKPGHLRSMAFLALDMLEKVRAIGEAHGVSLGLRVGIHSGPVVAGVIGRRKFTYDLWGDTVNTSSRMESHGVAGRIHVSERIQAELADEFEFEDRGLIDIKGKGPMRTFFLNGARRKPS